MNESAKPKRGKSLPRTYLHASTWIMLALAASGLFLLNVVSEVGYTGSGCAIAELRGWPMRLGGLYGTLVDALVASFILLAVGFGFEGCLRYEPGPAYCYKNRPVYSEEQLVDMDSRYPDEADHVAEILKQKSEKASNDGAQKS